LERIEEQAPDDLATRFRSHERKCNDLVDELLFDPKNPEEGFPAELLRHIESESQ